MNTEICASIAAYITTLTMVGRGRQRVWVIDGLFRSNRIQSNLWFVYQHKYLCVEMLMPNWIIHHHIVFALRSWVHRTESYRVDTYFFTNNEEYTSEYPFIQEADNKTSFVLNHSDLFRQIFRECVVKILGMLCIRMRWAKSVIHGFYHRQRLGTFIPSVFLLLSTHFIISFVSKYVEILYQHLIHVSSHRINALLVNDVDYITLNTNSHIYLHSTFKHTKDKT